jgi:hypothetical protein
MICDVPLRQKGWIRHHVNYDTDTTILICRVCHAWIHGRGCFNHIFKMHYAPDEAPLVFAEAVVRAYMAHDPTMGEAVELKGNDNG